MTVVAPVVFSFGHPARRVIRPLVIAASVRGATIGVGALVVGLLTDGRDALLVAAVSGAGISLLFALIGVGQAIYWWLRHGDTRYDFCVDRLVVVRDAKVIRSWPRSEVYYVAVDGSGASWYGLFTNSAGLPRLVLRTTSGGREEGPTVFFWGQTNIPGLELRLRDWRS